MRLLIPAFVAMLTAGQAQAASFDCAKAAHPVEKTTCAQPDLSEKDGRLGALYRERLALLSPQGQEILRAGQRQWTAMVRTLCADGGKGCIDRWLDLRLRALGNAGVQNGPFRFVGIDHYGTEKVSAADPFRKTMPYASLVRSYPQIDGDQPAAARWNALMRETFDNHKPEADTDDYLGFSVSYASERAISIRFEPYTYPHGAAHGMGGAFGHTVLLDSGRKLAAGDLFRSDAPWQDALFQAAWDDLQRQAKAVDVTLFPEAAKAVRESVPDPESWLLAEQGLVLLFQPYSVGPYSFGTREVLVPWPVLQPLLAAEGPMLKE